MLNIISKRFKRHVEQQEWPEDPTRFTFEQLMKCAHIDVDGTVPDAPYLKASGVDVNVRDAQGYTPLLLTCTRSLENTRRLLAAGADPNRCLSGGWSPLHFAAQSVWHEDIVVALLDAHADPGALACANSALSPGMYRQPGDLALNPEVALRLWWARYGFRGTDQDLLSVMGSRHFTPYLSKPGKFTGGLVDFGHVTHGVPERGLHILLRAVEEIERSFHATEEGTKSNDTSRRSHVIYPPVGLLRHGAEDKGWNTIAYEKDKDRYRLRYDDALWDVDGRTMREVVAEIRRIFLEACHDVGISRLH